MQNIKKLRETALEAAKAGGKVLMSAFGQTLEVEDKGGASPLVSKADRESETAIMEVIQAAFPGDSFIGEESGETGSTKSKQTWVVDPLDGTTAFLTGLPTFTVLIGIWEGDQPLFGVIHHPLSGDTWAGGPDLPTTLNGNPLPVFKGTKVLATSRPDLFGDEAKQAYEASQKEAQTLAFGGDGLQFGKLAQGQIWRIIEDQLAWHDIAGPIPVLMGAGATITDLSGNALKPGQDTYGVIATAKSR